MGACTSSDDYASLNFCDSLAAQAGGGLTGTGEVEGTIAQASRVSEMTALRQVVPIAHGSLPALLGRLR